MVWRSYWNSAVNLWGLFSRQTYDVIVVGAGAAGCPLAQTLAEGNLKVLLLERGGEPPATSRTIFTQDEAFRDDCAETFSSDGIRIITGNCMGGASSINQGIYVQQTPNFFQVDGEPLFEEGDIHSAFDWVRERVSPAPSTEADGSGSQIYLDAVVDVLEDRDDFNVTNTDPGQAYGFEEGVWRAHSIFDPNTQERKSADTMLDRENPNLDVRTYARVDRLLFDGDWTIPLAFRVSSSGLTARCVVLDTWERICVKEGGRIILSAGAIHTPIILMRSGIRKGGDRVNNPDVGQHLSDKPVVVFTTNPDPSLDNTNHVTYSHIVATQKHQPSNATIIYEDFTVGIPRALLNVAAFQRAFFPLDLRDSLLADLATMVVDICSNRIPEDGSKTLIGNSPLCIDFKRIIDAGCDRRLMGIGAMLGEPSSRGSVSLGKFGRIHVDVNFVDTEADKEALGQATRVGFEVATSIEGPAAPQQPCADDAPAECRENSCPDILGSYFASSQDLLGFIAPGVDLPPNPISVVQPGMIENTISTRSSDADIGETVKDVLIAAHHLAGTAQFGKVINSRFQVRGAENLYIVDGSALPRTTPWNPMASIMMMGRIAGLQAVSDMSTSR